MLLVRSFKTTAAIAALLTPLMASAQTVVIESGPTQGESVTQEIGAVGDAGGTCLSVSGDGGKSYIMVPEGAPLDPVDAINMIANGSGAASCADAAALVTGNPAAFAAFALAAPTTGAVVAAVLGVTTVGIIVANNEDDDDPVDVAAATPPTTTDDSKKDDTTPAKKPTVTPPPASPAS